MAGRSKHAAPRRRKKNRKGLSIGTIVSLLVCLLCFSAAFFLWKAALAGPKRNREAGEEEDFRPVVGDPPYRLAVDAGHGGSDPGAQGIVTESEMTAQTAQDLLAWLEADSNYIPLISRESYDVTAKPSERAAAIHASRFECYPSDPVITWLKDSYYFARQLAEKMQQAGAKLRGQGGIRYIYYQGEAKQLVESNHTEVREERSFTLLEDVDCPAVLAEQCFVTSEEDVAQFGSETGCKKTARAYYEAICAYFDTEPLPEAFETRHNG